MVRARTHPALQIRKTDIHPTANPPPQNIQRRSGNICATANHPYRRQQTRQTNRIKEVFPMIELEGKYGKAVVFTDLVEGTAISQIIGLLNMPYMENAHIRMMPDVHTGVGCTIGTTLRITNGKICPNLVGVDIGCGMYTVMLQDTDIDFARLDSIIRQYIPSGMSVRETSHEYTDLAGLDNLSCAKYVRMALAPYSIGSLGGGNHFIEVDKDDEGHLYLVIHTGSRNLGVQIATYYQELAYKNLTTYSKDEKQAIIDRLTAEGRKTEIQSVLNSLTAKTTKIPKDLAYVEGYAYDDYIHDMTIGQKFAELNRLAIADEIIRHMHFTPVPDGSFQTIHNYIDMKTMTLRKGAVSAQKDEKLLIPINMRDGSLLCAGKGNTEWNCSAPHGAGRLMSRSAAKESISMDEFKDSMEGIYSTSVIPETIDESPMAYKPMESIVENIQPTAEIVQTIRPVYNFKAS
jgi:RNA-splicing ligase RtcB